MIMTKEKERGERRRSGGKREKEEGREGKWKRMKKSVKGKVKFVEKNCPVVSTKNCRGAGLTRHLISYVSAFIFRL